MGSAIRRQKPEAELQYRLRKQNCRMIKSLYKILEAGYKDGYLSEVEFCMTLSWYHGLKHRMNSQNDQVFIQGLDRINEFICGLIEERYNEELKNKPNFVNAEIAELCDPEYFQVNPETDKVEKKITREAARKANEKHDKKLNTYRQILENSPYIQSAGRI